MTELLQLALYFFASVNPAAAAAAPRPRGQSLRAEVIAGGSAVALVVLALAAVLAEPILDGLGVEPETFRVGAGVVLLVSGALAVWRGAAAHQGSWEGRGAALFPLGLPVLATPAAVAAAICYGADDGASKTIGASLIVVAAAAALLFARAGRYQAAIDAVARLTGAALVVVAAGLVVDGVRAI